MKKTLRNILSLFLVLVMLLGVSATTVLAADGSGSGNSGNTGSTGNEVIDEVITGWFDVSYTKDSVTVVVTPDKDAILDTDKAQIKAILSIVIDAAKQLLVEDVKNEILGSYTLDQSGSIPITNPETVWLSALNGYIVANYGEVNEDSYRRFFKDITTNDVKAQSFADYVCGVLETAIILDYIEIAQLPDSAVVASVVKTMLENTKNAKLNFATEQAFEEYFGYLQSEISARFANAVDNQLVPVYEQFVIDVNAEAPKFDPIDLIKYLHYVEIDGCRVFNEDGEVSIEALKDLVKELPRPSEIENFTNEEMQLSFDVSIALTIGTKTDFNATVKLSGGYDTVRKLAGIIADHVELYVDNTGRINFTVNVPAKFSDILLKACTSTRVPDALKEKVFAACTVTPDKAYAYIENLSFEDFMELLEYVDFDEILDSKFVSQFESLDGLTEQQILNKVREYEGYYNKLISYIKVLYGKFPAQYKDNNLMDLYDGEGRFFVDGKYTFNIEEVLAKVSEKYAAIVASFIDEKEITVDASVKVTFEEINSVEFYVGNELHSKGLLPEGADLAFFAGITQVEGYDILGWYDEHNVEYKVMPDADVKLYAKVGQAQATASSDVSKVYDALEETLTVSVTNATSTSVFTYQWYKGQDAITGATEATLKVKNVADSGSYYCVVTVTDGNRVYEATSNTVLVEITQKEVDLSVVEWDYVAPIYYSGNEITVLIKEADLPDYLAVVANSYVDNKKTVAGSYTATATIEVTDANYKLPAAGGEVTLDWVIEKSVLDFSALTWNYDPQTPPTYTGSAITVELNSVGQVTFEYEGNVATNVGTYTARVTSFTINDDNYTASAGGVEDIPTLTWSISPKEINLSALTWSYTAPFVYDTASKTVTLNNLGDIVVSYTNNTAVNAGTYTAGATVSTSAAANANYTFVGAIPECTWVINKAVLNLSNLTWNYTQEFVYDGSQFVVYLVDVNGSQLPSIFTYSGNKATNVGRYTAVATITSEAENNYILEGSFANSLEWSIANRAFVLGDDVQFNNATVIYDGQPHSLAVTGTLPEGTVVTYSPASVTAIGEHVITATISHPNYGVKTLTATLTIVSGINYSNSFEYRDSNGNLILNITAENGISDDHVLNFKDVTLQYKDTVLPDSLFDEGKQGKVSGAYDIHFAVDGVENAVSDSFSVQLLIPANLRSADKELKVVHIAENGEITDMEATRDGDYMVFDTTHFSIYAIIDITPIITDDEGEFPWWIVILIAVLLVIIIVLLIIILYKKNNKEDDDNDQYVADKADDELVAIESTKEELVVEEPVVEEPVVEEPVVEEPVVEEPVVEEPVVEEPVVEEPVVEAPVVEEPVVEEPVVEEPVVEEPVVEAPVVEEPVVEEPTPAPVIMTANTIIAGGVEIPVRYRHSFMSRLIQSEPPIQDYYTVVKNELLSYKGVKARTSWNFESFNKGRFQCAKLNVKGKNFLVYLGLDPKEYNVNKYHFVDVSDKPKVGDVPMMLKVKSERGLKYVIELIEEMMKKNEIERVDTPSVDYHMPYETTEALAARDLVKVILPAGITLDENSNLVRLDVGELLDAEKKADGKIVANVTEETEIIEAVKEEPVVEEPVVEEPVVEAPVVEAPVVEEPAVEEPVVEEAPIDAVHADELISDEEAEEKIEVVEENVVRTGKFGEINLDTICENFENDESVSLDELKAKRLVKANVGRIKVLARGVMTKRLTVTADKFSLQAVKMITLAGGTAKQYNK